MQMIRVEASNARWERNSAGRGCVGGERGGGSGSYLWLRKPWVRGAGWRSQGKGWGTPSTGKQKAHVTLGLKVIGVALAAQPAEQLQALMILGQLAPGQTLASQNEHLLHATNIMH